MSGADLAAVLVAAVSLVATAVITITVLALLRTMRELRGVLDALHEHTLPLVADLRGTIDQAGADLARVEGILDSAERISHTVDAASQLTYRAFSPPLIKTMSFLAGVRRAGRRLRGAPDLARVTTLDDAAEPSPASVRESNHVTYGARGRRRRSRVARPTPTNDPRR